MVKRQKFGEVEQILDSRFSEVIGGTVGHFGIGWPRLNHFPLWLRGFTGRGRSGRLTCGGK